MGIYRSPLVRRVFARSDLSSADKVVFGWLVHSMRVSGGGSRRVWASVDLVAEGCGLGRRSVSRSLGVLESAGLIMRWRRQRFFEILVLLSFGEVEVDGL